MAVRLSRRKLAAYVAEKLLSGSPKEEVLKELAAYLIDTRRTREMNLIVRDIEDALAVRGLVIADIVAAHSLTPAIKAEIKTLVGAGNLQIRETIDPTVLGGVQVNLPGRRFDGTIRRKLNALKANKV